MPAFVLIPKGADGRKVKAPGIVALHDHGGFYRWGKEKLVKLPDEHPALTAFKKGGYDGHSIADDLAEQGYVVIVIDMFYWGEAVYAKCGAADRFRGHLYDTPHEFNAEMQKEAWEWLRKWI